MNEIKKPEVLLTGYVAGLGVRLQKWAKTETRKEQTVCQFTVKAVNKDNKFIGNEKGYIQMTFTRGDLLELKELVDGILAKY